MMFVLILLIVALGVSLAYAVSTTSRVGRTLAQHVSSPPPARPAAPTRRVYIPLQP